MSFNFTDSAAPDERAQPYCLGEKMMEPYAIRAAEERDAQRISELLEQLGYVLPSDGVRRGLRRYAQTGGKVWVATTNGEVAGFLSFQMMPYFHSEGIGGRITAMCVDSGHRRRGAGRALLAEMEGEAAALGCERVEVTSGDHRKDGAHVFYQASGYALSSGRFLKALNNTEQADETNV